MKSWPLSELFWVHLAKFLSCKCRADPHWDRAHASQDVLSHPLEAPVRVGIWQTECSLFISLLPPQLWIRKVLRNSTMEGIDLNWLSCYFSDGWAAKCSSLCFKEWFFFKSVILKFLLWCFSLHSLNCHFNVIIFIPCCSSALERWLVHWTSRTHLCWSPHQEPTVVPHGLCIPLHFVLRTFSSNQFLKGRVVWSIPLGCREMHMSHLYSVNYL